MGVINQTTDNQSFTIQRIQLLRRHPKLVSGIIAGLLLWILIRLEWAWFSHRLRILSEDLAFSPTEEASLVSRIEASEELYQEYARLREQTIKHYGPTSGEIEAFPTHYEPFIMWDFFVPAFNCPHVRERVGTLGDGGKWTCGLERLARKRDCVIYSVGADGDSSFEGALLRRTKYCKLHVYDHNSRSLGFSIRSIDRFRWRSTFKPYQLAGTDGVTDGIQRTTLPSLMFQNGHEFVDIVKIDIEGAEFATLASLLESYSGVPLPFGQLLVEIHAHDLTFNDVYKWWEAMEQAGLRPFYMEPNLVYANINRGTLPDISEFAFLNIRGQHTFVTPMADLQ